MNKTEQESIHTLSKINLLVAKTKDIDEDYDDIWVSEEPLTIFFRLCSIPWGFPDAREIGISVSFILD